MSPSAIATALIVLILAAGQQAKPPARPREPLLTKLLRISGLTAAPSQMKGPADDTAVGNVWMVDVGSRAARALTTDGGYRSPIFLPNGSTVLALRGNAIVQLGSAPQNVAPVRMKAAVTFTGASHVAPLSVERLTRMAPPLTLKSFQDTYIRP